MAIDTTMFGVSIAAGTYAKGTILPMPNLRGPSVVRDGYGPAYLKRLFCISCNTAGGAAVKGHVVFKNSNWVDMAANIVTGPSGISLADNASNIQKGHDAPLQVNSGWDVSFVFDDAATTTAAQDIVALIDIDYPSVQAVQNPRESVGLPVTIVREDSITQIAYGNLSSAVWTTINVDFLKAGSKYMLTEIGAIIPNSNVSFVSISGAAGQNGLERIIPVMAGAGGYLRYLLDYSTPLVKGPMNLNYLSIATSAGTATTVTEIDWVKK